METNNKKEDNRGIVGALISTVNGYFSIQSMILSAVAIGCMFEERRKTREGLGWRFS